MVERYACMRWNDPARIWEGGKRMARSLTRCCHPLISLGATVGPLHLLAGFLRPKKVLQLGTL